MTNIKTDVDVLMNGQLLKYLEGILTSDNMFDAFFKSRETVFYLVKSKKDQRLIFIEEKRWGIQTCPNNALFLSWRGSGVIGLYNICSQSTIYIASKKEAENNFEYVSDKPIKKQIEAYNAIKEKNIFVLEDI